MSSQLKKRGRPPKPKNLPSEDLAPKTPINSILKAYSPPPKYKVGMEVMLIGWGSPLDGKTLSGTIVEVSDGSDAKIKVMSIWHGLETTRSFSRKTGYDKEPASPFYGWKLF